MFEVGIRWTIGDVSERGFEALRYSIRGAWGIFGDHANYAVCVNSISVAQAQQRTGALRDALRGALPVAVRWIQSAPEFPAILQSRFDPGMAEGVAWKFAPLQVFPDRCEIALDNDCILWRLPAVIEQWLKNPQGRCVLAADVRVAYGQFAPLCDGAPRNCGIRGLPPRFDLAGALRDALDHLEARCGSPVQLGSELDEQGLQTAALLGAASRRVESPSCQATRRRCRLLTVPIDDVTLCSPFHPLHQHLGSCGAHFVGINAHHTPWNYFGRAADDWIAEHWQAKRPEIERLLAAIESGA